jgi:hypothetical protein
LLEKDVGVEIKAIREQRALGSRPTLADRAGLGLWEDVKPGKLWEKALEISGGQPNLAIALIGLCGHDDAIQVKPALIPQRSETLRYQTVEKNVMNSLRRNLLESARSGNTRSNDLVEDIDEYLAELDTANLPRITCLNSSHLFVPQALGPSVDLPQQLKDRIARIQAPTLGASVLPAKGYHFIASAMNACILRSQTKTSLAALIVNPMAARMYRAKRLNDILSSAVPDEIYNRLTRQDLDPIVSRYNSLPEDTRPPGERFSMLEEHRKFHNDPANEVIRSFSIGKRPVSTDAVLTSLLKQAARRDASVLARKWWTSYTFPAVGTVLLPSQRNRPEVRNAGIGLFHRVKDRCEEPGWSKERCDRAISVLDSWEIDFKWSEEQHYRGALFGYQNCRELGPHENLESLACRASSFPRPHDTPQPTEAVR